MALFRVSNNRAQFDAAGNEASDQYGAGIRFTQGGNARVTTGTATNYNQGIPMSSTGQVVIVDATAGLPADTIFHNGLPISGDKVCVSRNATAVVSNGLPYDAAGAVAGDINLDLNFIGTDTLNSSVTFTRASTATYFNSAGVLTSAAINESRRDFDPATLAVRGLLIEEQRTNSIRNNTMVGAVAGTPGTAPTNWGVTAIGLTQTIVGTGTENGITYIDIRLSGTTTGQFGNVRFEPNNNVVAAAGQSWTGSAYLKLVAGSLANIAEVGLSIYYWTSTPTFISAAATPAAVSASLARFSHVGTAPATTGFIQPGVYFNTTAASGQAVDFTLRIGLPQLEQGAFATSVIPTTTTALTRSADVASVNTLSPWYNVSAGTMYAEIGSAPVNTIPQFAYALNDNLGGGLGQVFTRRTGGSTVNTAVSDGGVTQADIGSPTTVAGSATYKVASAFAANDFAISLNGGAVVTDTSGALPSTIAKLFLGQNYVGGQVLNGYLRRITYYPRKLSSAELQAITA